MTLAALYFSATVFSSAYALTLDPEEFVCPVDGKKFMAEVVGSSAQFSIRLDLSPMGAVAAPAPRPVCPVSGFVMTKDTYTAKEAAAIRKLVSSPEFIKKRATYNDYYMAAFQLARLGGPVLLQAWFFHEAEWKAEDAGPPDATYLNHYRELSLQHFNKFFDSTTSKANLEWWDAQIVAANLERKLGRFDNTIKRIDNLPITKHKPSAQVKQFIKQTRQHAIKKNNGVVEFQAQ